MNTQVALRRGVGCVATLLLTALLSGCGSSEETEEYEPLVKPILDGKSDSTSAKVVTKGTISFGAAVESAFDDSKYHGYTFHAPKGAILGASLTSARESTDTVLMLYGPRTGDGWNGAPVVEDDNGYGEGSLFSNLSAVTIPEEGEYLLLATCKNKKFSGKPYRLSLRCDQGDCTAGPPRAVVEWTVLVYGSFDTHDSGGIPSSLEEMKFKLSKENSEVNLLYLEDLPEGPNTKLWEVHKGNATLVKNYGELHLGQAQTLTDVLRYVRETYPSRAFLLDLVGHTNAGLAAFLPDYYPAQANWADQRMLYWQIPQAILASGGKVDVLALSGCGTGDLEIAARLAEAADYIVGLQEYNTGYTDVRWADSLVRNSSIEPRGLAWRLAQGLFQNGYFLQGQPGAAGAYDASKVPAVKAALQELTSALQANLETSSKEYVSARKEAQSMMSGGFEAFVDAYDFAVKLETLSSDTVVREKAAAFRSALDDMIVGGGPPSFADEENHANAHGINMLFQYPGLSGRYTSPADFDQASAWPPEQTGFYEEAGWRAFVSALYGRF